MEEEWKAIDWLDDIPSDKYLISNMGQIKNLYTDKIIKSYLVHTPCDRMITLLTTAPRDISLRLRKPKFNEISKKKCVTVSRLVAIAFIPFPKGVVKYNPRVLTLCFKDNDPTNLRADNLEWRVGLVQKYTAEDRVKMFDLIKDNIDKPTRVIAQICSDELGRKITPQAIAHLIRSSNFKRKEPSFTTFGFNPSEWNRPPLHRKTPPLDVRIICESLCDCEGNLTQTMKELSTRLPHISRSIVENIKYKYHHAKISDEYFDWIDGEFIRIQR